MKMRRLFSFTLALLMAAAFTVPTLAVDEETPPILPEQETVESIQTPEDAEETEGIQDPEDVSEPEETQPSEDEPPENPAEPEDVQEPEPEEIEPPEDVLEPDVTQLPEDVLEPEETQSPEDIPSPIDILDEDLIEVVVPAVGEMLLNPYGMPVSTENGETTEQVIHQAQIMTNYSDFPVVVNATAIGSVDGARFTEEPLMPDSTEKEIFLYAEFQNIPDNWSGVYRDAPNQVVVTEDGQTREQILILDANGDGYFRLFGEMSMDDVFPAWDSENALTVELAYTFTRDVASMMEELPEEEFLPDFLDDTDFGEEELPVILDEPEPDEEEFPNIADETDPDEEELPIIADETDPNEEELPNVADEPKPDEEELPNIAGETEPDEEEFPVILDEPEAIEEELPVILDEPEPEILLDVPDVTDSGEGSAPDTFEATTDPGEDSSPVISELTEDETP